MISYQVKENQIVVSKWISLSDTKESEETAEGNSFHNAKYSTVVFLWNFVMNINKKQMKYIEVSL